MKTFFKAFFGFLAAMAFMIFIAFLIISSMVDTEPSISDHSYLHVKLSGGLSEYRAPDPFEEALGRSRMDVKKFRDDLEKALVDDRIEAVLLDLNFLNTGYGKLKEMHHLIRNFREKSDKKIYAYLGGDLIFTKDYYLATACDSVFMPAEADLFLTGVRAEITFYGSFFKKIGVQADFVHMGKYKNAPDVYTRDNMSGPHREVMENVVDYLYHDIIATIAESRGLAADRVESLINDQAGFSGTRALEAGLVDGTGFFKDVEKKLQSGDHKVVRLSAVNYARLPASSLKIRNKSRIAVINCVGTIMGGNDADDPLMGKVLGSGTIISNIEKAARSKSIKAIILRIDSPGGSSIPSVAIWDAIRKARQKKPVIASVSDYGASGGYYIAMAADTMLTNPSSLVGSIGIFAGKFNFSGLYDKLDLTSESVSRGRHSDLFSVMEAWSDTQRQLMQRLIAEFYEDFVDRVARARGMTRDEVDQLAQGRVWMGQEAVERNLFDAAGYFYDAVGVAKQMANIDSAESVRLVYYPRQKSLMSEIFSSISALIEPNSGLLAYRNLLRFLEQNQGKILAMMPYRVTIY